MIRVRNVSKAELIFIGGRLLPGEEKVFPNELALKLIKRNPKMLVGTIEEEVKVEETKALAVEEVLPIAEEEVKVEETRPQMKTRRKRK